MRIVGGLVIAPLCLALACGSKDKEQPENQPATGGSTATGTGDGGAAGADPAAPRLEPIAEAEVQAVVDAWLKAQNEGDFDAYAALYADRFTGVKRVGARTFRFDREGWLKDRGRMFESSMKVSLADTVIRSTPHLATATFEQTWQSGKFKDVGPKRLLIIRQDDELRIGNEEMLRSEVVSSPKTSSDVMLVIDTDDGLFVVLDQGVEEAWATGPVKPVALGIEEVHGTMREAAADKLPEKLQAWKDAAITAHDAAGAACPGTLASLHVIAGIDPHWSVDSAMNGVEEFGPPPDDQALWDMTSPSERVLVGRLQPSKGCTSNNLYAYPGEPRELPRLQTTSDRQDPPWQAFATLPGYRHMQKDFETHEGKGSWDDSTEVRSSVLRLVDDPAKPTIDLWLLTADAGPGCGGFGGALWAVFSTARGKPELRSDGKTAWRLPTVTTAADLDGDGVHELIGPGVILDLVDGKYTVVHELEFPSHDSPC